MFGKLVPVPSGAVIPERDIGKRPILNCINLGVTFGGLKAVDDFNLMIGRTEIAGLIGPNGAGKTTVFNLLTKVYQPTHGTILLDGQDTHNMTTAQVNRAGIARTFQNIRLFNDLTVEENVTVAMDAQMKYSMVSGIFRLPSFWKEEKVAHERALELLSLFHMQDLANVKAGSLPYGAGTAALLLETLLTHVNSIEYLQKRLKTWSDDLEKVNPQTKQSLYAIGSGGLKGLGLGNSVEKQLWLPESTNDFIFSVVCEELGFIGATLIIVLFILFIVQGLLIAYKAENQFCTMVGIGIMAQIAWQVFCNIAVVTNTIPNTGISLPFFSSGGTSLILLLAEMGVMVNIGRNGERAAQQRAADHTRREAERAAQEAERASRTINLEDARRARNGK